MSNIKRSEVFFKSFNNWAKQHKTLIISVGILILFSIWYWSPFKPIDPSNPHFIESQFRLRDYGSAEGAKILQDKVLPKLFPVGTPKAYVDLMMVERGGAEIIDQTDNMTGLYDYSFKPLYLLLTPDAFNIRFYFDKQSKVAAIHFSGKTIVGKDYQPKLSPRRN